MLRNVNQAGRWLWVLLLVGSAGALTGCASGQGGLAEGRSAVEGFADTRRSLDRASAQVDEVIVAMGALSTEQDLPAAKRNLDRRAEEMRSSAADARRRADAMSTRQAAFIERWQQEMATITDPQLQSTLEERRDAVREHYEQVLESGRALVEAYGPFDERVRQIQRTLTIDLTPATVAGIRPVLDEATAQGELLKTRIQKMRGELAKIEQGLSATPPTAAATE
jgi:hypothetical protein